MIKRPLRPTFNYADREELLKAMGRALTLSGYYGASIGYNSPQYRMAESLREAIKTLATDLTGDPYYFGGQTVVPAREMKNTTD
jgi:Ni,Fe-hydrogenase III large subunit